MHHQLREPVRTQVVQRILRWCIAHDLLNDWALRRSYLTWTPELFEAIAETQTALGEVSFRQLTIARTRSDNFAQTTQEDKSAGLSPRAQRVLVRLAKPCRWQGLQVHYSDMSYQDIDITCYQHLCVVENLDCFYELERFHLPFESDTTLIVYRGDKVYSHGTTLLMQRWLQQSHMCSYFGDFDISGACLALRGGYQYMVLPALADMQAHSHMAMIPDKQLHDLNELKRRSVKTAEAFTPYYQQLMTLKGIRQQFLQNFSLQLVPLLS